MVISKSADNGRILCYHDPYDPDNDRDTTPNRYDSNPSGQHSYDPDTFSLYDSNSSTGHFCHVCRCYDDDHQDDHRYHDVDIH
jgi:hypothetical protein